MFSADAIKSAAGMGTSSAADSCTIAAAVRLVEARGLDMAGMVETAAALISSAAALWAADWIGFGLGL